MSETNNPTGAFAAALSRNYKQLRDDRAKLMTDGAKMIFRRSIEDMEMQMAQLQQDREGLLDLGISSTTSIPMPSDFKANEFVLSDMKIGLAIRELQIKLDIAKERYTYLFGE